MCQHPPQGSRHVTSLLEHIIGIAVLVSSFSVQAQVSSRTDLAEMNLEDLMNVQVTSVSKKEQKISRTASAIFVITQEDIQRSGADNVPDLLRMVPGVDVAQINASKWAISIRGFNGQYSNKLLVLVDGRTVYTPTLSGVFWDTQDLLLDDVERIEVIRGPGATVWGANAVNGVINIISKKSSETQGAMMTTSGGTQRRWSAGARYGGELGARGTYRVFAYDFDGNHLPRTDGQSGYDDYRSSRAGFRADLTGSPRDAVTFESQFYRGDSSQATNIVVSLFPPVNTDAILRDRYSGWNLTTRWDHTLSEQSGTSLQVSFDHSNRGDATYGFGLSTLDVAFQHRIGLGARHDVVWGLGYRLSSDDTVPTSRISFDPMDETTQLFSAFAQDEIALRPDRIYVTVGAKLEQSSYTGPDVQPNARITWTPSRRHMFWAAVSRSVRTPARSETSMRVNFTAQPGPDMPALVALLPDGSQQAERMTATEAGYRTELTRRLSLDVAMFFNSYSHIASIEPQLPSIQAGPSPYLLISSQYENLLCAEAHGIEAFARWKAAKRWTLLPGYSLLISHVRPRSDGRDYTDAVTMQGDVPRHQAQLRSQLDLPAHWQWNTSLYFVDRLPALALPAYTRLDSSLTWHATQRFSISVVGQNLIRDHHLEYAGPTTSVLSSVIRRGAYAHLTWWF